MKNKAPIVLCELLFDEKMLKEKQITKHKNLFIRLVDFNRYTKSFLVILQILKIDYLAAALMKLTNDKNYFFINQFFL